MLRAGLDSAPASASASASGSGSASSKAKPVPVTKPKATAGKKNKAVASATSAEEPAKKKKKSADGSAAEVRPPRNTPDGFYKDKGGIRGPVKGETDKQKRKRMEMNHAFKVATGQTLEIKKAKFNRMVRAILEEICEKNRTKADECILQMEKIAKEGLRLASENYLVEEWFQKVAMAATHAGRVTAKPADMWLVDAMVFDSEFTSQFKNAEDYKKLLHKHFEERAAKRAAEAAKRDERADEQEEYENAQIDPEIRRIYESASSASAAAAEDNDEEDLAAAARVPMGPVPVFSASASAAAVALAPLVVPAALFAQPVVAVPEVKAPVVPVAAQAATAVVSAAPVAVPVSPSPVSGPEPMSDAVSAVVDRPNPKTPANPHEEDPVVVAAADAAAPVAAEQEPTAAVVPVVDRPNPKTPVNPHEEESVVAAAAAPVAAEKEPTVAAAPVAAKAVASSKPKKVRKARMTEAERLKKSYLEDAKTNA